MESKTIFRGLIFVVLLILVSSFTFDMPVKKFSPAGSWEYSVPGVQLGYESGTMIITEDGKAYKVSLQLNEYFKAEAENVVYKRKDLSFSVYVESEEILISGSFKEDKFTANLSYSEGEFDLIAVRKRVQ